jgi:hypothetical protein
MLQKSNMQYYQNVLLAKLSFAAKGLVMRIVVTCATMPNASVRLTKTLFEHATSETSFL